MKFYPLKKLIYLLDSSQKKRSIILIILMCFASILELIGLGFIIIMINYFLGNSELVQFGILEPIFYPLFNSFNFSKNFNFVLTIFFLIFTFKLLIMTLTSWLESYLLADFQKKINFNLYSNFLKRDPSNIFRKNSAEYLRNFTEEINLSMLFFSSVLRLSLDYILFLAIVIFLLFYNPLVSISAIAFFSIVGLIYMFSVSNIFVSWAKKGLQNRKKKIQFVKESFSALKNIKILSKENYFLKKFKIQSDSLANISFKVSFLNLMPRHILEYILFLTILILLIFLSKSGYSNEKIIQMMSVYLVAAFRLIPTLNKILVQSQSFKFSYPSLIKLYNENNQKILVEKNTKYLISFKKNIKLRIKKFNYETKREFFLKNISLDIPKRSIIGIIGPSGSGKSTLVDILSGFKRLHSKCVLVDGRSINLNINNWQKKIGYIPQNIIILNQSLRENILFDKEKNQLIDQKILKVLKQTNLYNFFKKLPKGLDQIISEDGINISGGEKQRIGIARALINDPELIIFDEATSGLDTFTENKILEEIKELKKTFLIVTHRTNTLNLCDKVYSIRNNTLNRMNKKNEFSQK